MANLKRPKWEVDLNNLEGKIFLNTQQNFLPTPRDLFNMHWEAMKPIIIEFISRNFVLKKRKQK